MPFPRAQVLFVALATFLGSAASAADCGCHLLGDEAVQARTGWRTDWTVQLPVDSTRFGVTHVVVADDLVVAQTSDGGVHAIAVGKGPSQGMIRWSRRIGPPNGSMHQASVGPTLVSVANDRTIHGLRKTDGSTAFAERFSKLVEAGPTEAGGSVYVPLAGGTIERMPAEPSTNPAIPLNLAANGLLLTAPVPLGERAVGWITTTGRVVALQPFADSWERSDIQLPSPAAGQPIVRGDDMLVVTTVGDLVRLHIRRTSPVGLEPVWRMPLPGRPDGAMIIDGETIFVSLGLDGIVAVAADTGGILWHANGPTLRFRRGMGLVAAGAGRVWCLDAVGRLSLLDAASGSRIGCAPLDGFTVPVFSSSPGRLVLARPDGRLMALSPSK